MLVFYLSLLESDEDKSKFIELYDKYGKLMKYVALQKLDDEHLAEDAVHNAFLNVIKSFYIIDEINCHKTKRLLVIITENVAIDMLRKNKRYSGIDLADLEPLLSIEPDMLDNMAAQDLVTMITELPEIYRNVLELYAYHELSEKQIATVLGIEYATVRKRLERARAMLAKKLKGQERGAIYEKST